MELPILFVSGWCSSSRVKRVSRDGDGVFLFLGEFYFGGVEIGVEFAANGESGGCCGVGDHVHDGLLGFQWSAPPVEGDPGEQPVFDPVPFTGAGRIVAHHDLQACGFG